MRRINYFLTGIIRPAESHVISFNDHTLRYYSFTIGTDVPDTYLFFIGGSGCVSLKYYLREYLKGLKGNIRVFALQKRGVNHYTTGIIGCSEEFYRNDYLEKWISDQELFINYILEHSEVKPEHVVILGVSEGCTTSAVLANRVPHITHLSMIGCGGMRFIDELRLLKHKGFISFDVDALYQKVMKEPTSTSGFVAGHTCRYWASLLEVDPVRFLIGLDIPIIVVMGDNDRSVPVESVLYLKRMFKRADRDNLTVVIYPGADHTLSAPGMDYRLDFMKRLSGWIYRNNIR